MQISMEVFLRLFIGISIICIFDRFQQVVGNNNYVWEYFYRPGNVAILEDEYRSEGKAATRLDCASRCLQCPAIAFNEVTRECRHYTRQNVTMIPVLPESSDPGLWVTKQMALTSAQTSDARSMTNLEADNLCKEVGGRLATYMELVEAGNDGFHLCRCGWLADGTARLLLQYEDPACTHVQYPGLHTCKILVNGQRVYDTHYGAAYCKYTF